MHPSNAVQKESMDRIQRAHITASTVESVVITTMSGVFFTLLVKQMGVSDALAGTLSTIVFCGSIMQAVAVAFIRKLRSIRSATMLIQTFQYLLYAFLYLLPFIPLPKPLRIPLFVFLFVIASLSSHLIAPVRFHWMMSFVPNHRRGVFYAYKDMFAIIITCVYNLVMGQIVDYFTAIGYQQNALFLCAVTIILLLTTFLISIHFTKDAPEVLNSVKKIPSISAAIRSTLHNRTLVKILVVGTAWNFFCFFTTSYHNVYLLQELESSATFIVIAGLLSNVVRIFLSIPFGKFADRYGFARTLTVGFVFAAISFGILIFWRPANGQLLYLIYQIPHSCALASLAGSLVNVLLQYVKPQDRVSSQGIYSASNGIFTFLGSFLGGQLLAMIQANGNRFWGFPIYGQQLLSLISCLALFILVLYTHKIVEIIPRIE